MRFEILQPPLEKCEDIQENLLRTKTSQELRMLSRSLSDCKSLTLNVIIKFRNLSVIVNCVTKSLTHWITLNVSVSVFVSVSVVIVLIVVIVVIVVIEVTVVIVVIVVIKWLSFSQK